VVDPSQGSTATFTIPNVSPPNYQTEDFVQNFTHLCIGGRIEEFQDVFYETNITTFCDGEYNGEMITMASRTVIERPLCLSNFLRKTEIEATNFFVFDLEQTLLEAPESIACKTISFNEEQTECECNFCDDTAPHRVLNPSNKNVEPMISEVGVRKITATEHHPNRIFVENFDPTSNPTRAPHIDDRGIPYVVFFTVQQIIEYATVIAFKKNLRINERAFLNAVVEAISGGDIQQRRLQGMGEPLSGIEVKSNIGSDYWLRLRASGLTLQDLNTAPGEPPKLMLQYKILLEDVANFDIGFSSYVAIRSLEDSLEDIDGPRGFNTLIYRHAGSGTVLRTGSISSEFSTFPAESEIMNIYFPPEVPSEFWTPSTISSVTFCSIIFIFGLFILLFDRSMPLRFLRYIKSFYKDFTRKKSSTSDDEDDNNFNTGNRMALGDLFSPETKKKILFASKDSDILSLPISDLQSEYDENSPRCHVKSLSPSSILAPPKIENVSDPLSIFTDLHFVKKKTLVEKVKDNKPWLQDYVPPPPDSPLTHSQSYASPDNTTANPPIDIDGDFENDDNSLMIRRSSIKRGSIVNLFKSPPDSTESIKFSFPKAGQPRSFRKPKEDILKAVKEREKMKVIESKKKMVRHGPYIHDKVKSVTQRIKGRTKDEPSGVHKASSLLQEAYAAAQAAENSVATFFDEKALTMTKPSFVTSSESLPSVPTSSVPANLHSYVETQEDKLAERLHFDKDKAHNSLQKRLMTKKNRHDHDTYSDVYHNDNTEENKQAYFEMDTSDNWADHDGSIVSKYLFDSTGSDYDCDNIVIAEKCLSIPPRDNDDDNDLIVRLGSTNKSTNKTTVSPVQTKFAFPKAVKTRSFRKLKLDSDYDSNKIKTSFNRRKILNDDDDYNDDRVKQIGSSVQIKLKTIADKVKVRISGEPKGVRKANALLLEAQTAAKAADESVSNLFGSINLHSLKSRSTNKKYQNRSASNIDDLSLREDTEVRDSGIFPCPPPMSAQNISDLTCPNPPIEYEKVENFNTRYDKKSPKFSPKNESTISDRSSAPPIDEPNVIEFGKFPKTKTNIRDNKVSGILTNTSALSQPKIFEESTNHDRFADFYITDPGIVASAARSPATPYGSPSVTPAQFPANLLSYAETQEDKLAERLHFDKDKAHNSLQKRLMTKKKNKLNSTPIHESEQKKANSTGEGHTLSPKTGPTVVKPSSTTTATLSPTKYSFPKSGQPRSFRR
jgi:hypothetical protein